MTKEEEFVQGLYDESEEEIKEVYKEQKENRDNLLKELALIMLSYTIIDGLMSLTTKDKNKEYNRLSSLILKSVKGQGAAQEKVIKDVLTNTVKKTFGFYSYNANLKDVRKIIDKNFKGKHFSTRVWENEKDVAKYLHKQVNDFLKGKINVNQVKRGIERTYNSSAYNAKRLAETEVARCEDEAFKRFCRETGVKKVRRVATLDNRTCSDCSSFDGKVYDLKDAPDLPAHPLCRCFYEIVDEKYEYVELNYMSNRFIPKFKEYKTNMLGEETDKKKVINSNFDMWTDMDSTSKNKAVRFYEKKIKELQSQMPIDFTMPRFVIMDFEKSGIDEPKAIGGYSREKDTLYLNSKYDTSKKIEEFLRTNKGYFANVDNESPLLHELGHKYHYDLADKIAKKYDIGYNEAKERFDKSIEDYIRNKDHITSRYINNISGYAADEFEKNKIYNSNKRMNELMAEYFTIKDNDNELIKFINSKIKEMTKNDD